MISVEIDDRQIRAVLNRLSAAAGKLRPAMQSIGELLAETTRRRFAAGHGPDGAPWAPNSEVTVLNYLRQRGGSFKKDGSLSKRGQRASAAKKPLIGESHRLSTEIHYQAADREVRIGSSLAYAATQQFGARKGQFGAGRHGRPLPWGDIPARPFLGISSSDEDAVLRLLHNHLARAAGQHP